MEQMRMGRWVTLGWGLMMLALAGPAKGELMAYEFTGVIDWVTDTSGVLDGSVQVGTEFSGRFTFDSEAQDTVSDSTIGSFTAPPFSMTVNAGSYSWYSGAGNSYIRVANDDWGHDSLILSKITDFLVDGVRIGPMSVEFYDESGQAFSADTLPILDPFPFSAFDHQHFEIDGVRVSDYASFKFGADSFTSFVLVPEPTAVLLMAFGLGLLQRLSVSHIV